MEKTSRKKYTVITQCRKTLRGLLCSQNVSVLLKIERWAIRSKIFEKKLHINQKIRKGGGLGFFSTFPIISNFWFTADSNPLTFSGPCHQDWQHALTTRPIGSPIYFVCACVNKCCNRKFLVEKAKLQTKTKS